jgi:hypothetical protein
MEAITMAKSGKRTPFNSSPLMTGSINWAAGFDVFGKCFLSDGKIKLELRAPVSDIGIKEIGRVMEDDSVVDSTIITSHHDKVIVEMVLSKRR